MPKKWRVNNWAGVYFVTYSILALLNVGVLAIRILKGQMLLYDLFARWQECAYVLKGLYPYNINPQDVISTIGKIDPYMVTVPWAWILGNVINPGFLSFEYAKFYALVISILTIIISAIIAYHYILCDLDAGKLKKYKRFALILFATLVIDSQYPWSWGVMMGNQGILVGCFLFISVCVYKKHPYIAGILLSISMIKPQAALIFVFTFLFMKKFKVFFTALIVGGISYLMALIFTGQNFFKPIIDTFHAGTSLGAVFFGLFDYLKNFNVSINLILVMDMVAGIIYLILYVRKSYSMGINDSLTIFSGVAIASTFWFYKQPHDYIILIIPLFLLVQKGLSTTDYKSKFKFWVLSISIVANFYIQVILKTVLYRLTGVNQELIKGMVMTLACFFFMWIGYMCIDKRFQTTSKQNLLID